MREKAVFLQRFARIDTANPPGDTRQAADFFRAFLDKEGIAHRTEAPKADNPNLIASFEPTIQEQVVIYEVSTFRQQVFDFASADRVTALNGIEQ